MSKSNIVKSVILGSNNPNKAAVYADGFQFTHSAGDPPMDKSSWLGMETLILASFAWNRMTTNAESFIRFR